MNALPHRAWPVLRICLLAAVLGSTTACGLKGPLYLPDQKPEMVEVKKPGSIPAVLRTRKKEGSETSKPSGDNTEPATTPPEQ